MKEQPLGGECWKDQPSEILEYLEGQISKLGIMGTCEPPQLCTQAAKAMINPLDSKKLIINYSTEGC